MRFQLNKKAEDEAHGDWPIFIMIFIFAVTCAAILFYVIVANNTAYRTFTPTELEETILINKILSSNECFAMKDIFGEFIPLSVDLSRFTQDILASCYPVQKTSKSEAYSILLQKKSGDIVINTTNWDIEKYPEKNYPTYFATVYDAEKKENAKLIISVQNAKR